MALNATIERFLAAPFLAEADPDARLAVLEAMIEHRADQGAILLEQGHPNDHISFLIEGTAEIVRTFPEGRQELVASLTAPAVFGTTSFFRSHPPTVSVRATSPVWLLTLDHPAHEKLRENDPRAAEALALATVRVLSEQFDMIDQRISAYIRLHEQNGHSEPTKPTEWASFRAKLFEESNF